MSRRLKHFKEEHEFFIKTVGEPGTECIVRNRIDENIRIYQKYVNKGHTKDGEIKKIDKTIKLTQTGDQLRVQLGIHVHHYTKVYFTLYDYLAQLNSDLNVPPASISHTPVTEPKVDSSQGSMFV